MAVRFGRIDAIRKRVYKVVINRETICRFLHRRSDGWSGCLRRAADAIGLNEWAMDTLVGYSKGG